PAPPAPPGLPEPSEQPASMATPNTAPNAACRTKPNPTLESAARGTRPVIEYLFNVMGDPPSSDDARVSLITYQGSDGFEKRRSLPNFKPGGLRYLGQLRRAGEILR